MQSPAESLLKGSVIKVGLRFGEFCYCFCLPLLPGLACSIHATWGPPFSPPPVGLCTLNGKYLGWAGQSRTFLGRPPRSDLRISHRFSPRPPPLPRCRPDHPRLPRPTRPPPPESPSPTTAGSKLEEESEGAISGVIPKIHNHPSSEL